MFPEQSKQKSQTSLADEIARANTLGEKVRAFLLGHDIFISYARADALDYAPRLANHLTKLGFRCYLDQLDAPAGVKTPEAVMTALGRSSSLVIVGTDSAAASIAVGDEVDFFSKLSRVILPIDVETALETAVWGKTIAGIARTRESAQAVQRGRPSRQVISRIYDSSQFRRRNRQLKHAGFGVLGVIALLIVVGGGLNIFFSRRAKAARDDQQTAESMRQKAVKDAENAQTLQTQAEQRLTEAQTKLTTAASELSLANEQTEVAQAATKFAQLEAKNVELKRAESERQARKQQVIAQSLGFANRSTRSLTQGLVTEGMAYAIKSAEHLSTVGERTVESDGALRRSLAMFPRALMHPRHTELKGGFSNGSFSPDGRQFIILHNDLSVQIYNGKDDMTGRQLAPPSNPPRKDPLSNACVALSNDVKRWALKKPNDNWVEVKDMESRQEWKITVGDNYCIDLALSADGRYLVVVTFDNAQLWSVQENKQVASLLGTGSNQLSPSDAAFSPDGKTLALGGTVRFGEVNKVEQGRIFIWTGFQDDNGIKWKQQDFDTKRKELAVNDDYVSCLALTNNADSFATCSGRVWSLTGYGRLEPTTYLPVTNLTRAVAFDPTGQSVSMVAIRLKKGITFLISELLGEHTAGWSYDVWSSSGYSAIAAVPYSGFDPQVRFDPEGKSILVLGIPEQAENGFVRYWNTKNWEEEKEKRLDVGADDGLQIGKPIAGRFAITETVDGKFFASARLIDRGRTSDYRMERKLTVNVWDLVKRTNSSVTPEGTCFRPNNLLLSSDGNNLVLLCNRDGPVPDSAVVYRRVRATGTNQFIKARDIELKNGEKLSSLSPDGKLLIVSYENTEEHRPRLLSIESGKEVNQNMFSTDMRKTIFSPDSKFVAALYWKETEEIDLAGHVEVFRLSDQKKLAEVPLGTAIFGLDFSRDSRYIAAAALSGKVTILDLHRKKPTPAEFNFIAGARDVVFDEHSRLLGVATGDAIRLIDLPTLQEIAEIPIEDGIHHLAFSYDGKYLAAIGNYVRIWNLSPEALLKEAKERLSSANQP